MIVVLNGLDLHVCFHIASGLAARYSEGGLVDIHAMIPDNSSQSLKKDLSAILIEKVRVLVSSAQKGGKEDLIVKYTFFTPQQLRQLRIAVSDYDDEVYAFRLHVAPDVLASLSLSPEFSTEQTSVAYNQWLEQQEAGAHYGDMGYPITIASSEAEETIDRIWEDIHAPVELADYRQEWPAMFAREKERIANALQGRIFSVEHIGSTAIPGMLAKPVIDILITVRQLDDAVECIQPLRELGYAFIDYPQNTDRRFFRKGFPRTHHIHIVEQAHPSARAYIRFRDALLADAQLRQEYMQLKQEGMQQFKYRRALYGEGKGALIRKALTKSTT